jgi:hypothetical protein
MLSMIGFAPKTPRTLKIPKKAANGIIGQPNVPAKNLMGIFPTFKKQKNIALVPMYADGDSLTTLSRYTFRMGPMAFVNMVAAPPTIPTTHAHIILVSRLTCCCCCFLLVDDDFVAFRRVFLVSSSTSLSS